jgi:hypothetical protein
VPWNQSASFSALNGFAGSEHLLNEHQDRLLPGTLRQHRTHFGTAVLNVAVDHFSEHQIALGADHFVDLFVLLAAIARAFTSLMVSCSTRFASHDFLRSQIQHASNRTVIEAPPNIRPVETACPPAQSSHRLG